MKRPFASCIPALTMLVLTACTTAPQQQPSTPDRAAADNSTADTPLMTQNSAPATPATTETPTFVEYGTDRLLNTEPSITSDSSFDEGTIEVNFNNAPLSDFIATVLGDVLGLNYLLDPDISGNVTLHTSTPLTESALYDTVEQVLSMHDARLLHSNGLYRIVPADNAGQNPVAPSMSALDIPGAGRQIFPLDFITASEMKKLLDPLMADPNTITIDETRNLIIASGTNNELHAIQDTIEIFDMDWLQGMSVGLFPLDNVDSETLAEELKSILGSSDNDESLAGLARLIPLERLNSLLAVSSRQSALREVETWIERLDQPGNTDGNTLYVYPVQNSKASDLANTLNNIFLPTAGLGTESIQEAATSPVAPGLTPVQFDAADNNPITAMQDNATATGDNVRIIADDVKNNLIIMAPPQSYRMIKSTLSKLDTVPLQVMIEASILEVSLRDDLSYGVEWFFKNSINNWDGTGMQDLGESGISALAPGFSYTLIDSASQVRFALNALASASEINILSAPSLMVLNNQTATINVGDEIPVPTRQSVSNLDPASPTVNEISFRKTGITLTVTPRVNDSGLVTMDIGQEVSSAATTTTSSLDAPTIQNRMIQSLVAINSGETIMLGGLMQEQQTSSDSGIPLLKDIPIVGELFSQNSFENARTELLVLITPKVVRNQNDARNITNEYRSKLNALPTLETAMSGNTQPPSDE